MWLTPVDRSVSVWVSTMLNTAWDRLLSLFILVAATVLDLFPSFMRLSISYIYTTKIQFFFQSLCSWQGKILENLSFRHGKLIICFVLLTQCCSIITLFFLKCVWLGWVDVTPWYLFNTHLTQFNPLAYGTGHKLFLFPL